MFEQILFNSPGSGLIGAILQQPEPIRLWVGWLVAVNLVFALLFVPRLEAVVTILIFVVIGVIMGQLYEIYGYSKILGVSHLIFWPPLMLWLTTRWYGIDSPLMRMWIAALILSNGVSLVLDAFDVAVFFVNR